MAAVSHQTIRLARGRHRSPDSGACVMELASMLAGEDFTDDPKCVDPVVAAFLRAFNDRLDHVRRQDLRPYASAVVGTRGSRRATRARRARCLQYASGSRHGGPLLRLRLFMLIGPGAAADLDAGIGEWAAREAIHRHDEAGGFALLDELLETATLALPVARGAEVGVTGAAAQLEVEPERAGEEDRRERPTAGAGAGRFER
jgi:hypothetical protein